MNSIGNILTGFEWDYDGPVSFMKGTGYQGKGVSRTMFLSPKLENIPEQLFAIKTSQSSNPAKAGKPVFKYFSYRFNENEKFNDQAPSDVTINMELSQVKNIVVSKLLNIPQAQFSLSIKLHGTFTNIQCADGVYAIYDEEKFPNTDPARVGDAPYYVRNDVNVHVKLKGAMSQANNEYLQSTISTTATSNEVFQAKETSKVWNGADNTTATANVSENPAQPGAPAVW